MIKKEGTILLNVLVSAFLITFVATTFVAGIIIIWESEIYSENYVHATLMANSILEYYSKEQSKKLPYYLNFAGDDDFDVEIEITSSSQFYVVNVTVLWEQKLGKHTVEMQGYYYEE
ncbi:hypothetical protein PRVXT_000938 [Proteinivorax tanatarense]|uniref:Uncharacterized protein n=1 Tax=Proteinivorax tanatarense TaxID=1260629 RepID=A0AAU7VP94_9FIRM